MLRTVNHRHSVPPSSRELDQVNDSKVVNNTPEWPNDDDDDFSIKESSKGSSNVAEQQSVDHGKQKANGENAASKFDNEHTNIPSTQQVPVGQDNGGGDDGEIITIENVDSSGQQPQNNDHADDTEKEVDIKNEVRDIDNTTFVTGEESLSTEYHRSQSTIQNEAPKDSTGETRTFDQSDNNINVNNDQVSENVNTVIGNNVDNNNEINVDSIVPALEQVDNQQQQSQLENTFAENYIEDVDEEESFFAMIQSTLQVVFLAAFFALGLVFRRRVQDRMSEHPSLNAAHAIKEEAIKVATDLATWLSGTRGESHRNVGGEYMMSSVVEGESSVRGSGSNRGETIPLATATDEEWGWDDDDVSGNLELAGAVGDTTNDEDDLAMAIAMSLSESAKGTVSETGCPQDDVVSRRSSPPAIAVEKPSNGHEQLAPPADTIEDLLGQMGNVGGPVISSFGQKAKIEPKSNKKSTDDIFESLGLSSFPTKAVPSQQQTNTPSSTFLEAGSMEEDCDDWGDDGDLDDLLLED